MSAVAAAIALAAAALLAIAIAHRRRFEAEHGPSHPGTAPAPKKRLPAFSTRRKDDLRARQLAMALPMAAELLRGGLTPESAVATIAGSVGAPLGPELSRVADEVASAGRTLDEAFASLAERTGSPDLALVSDAVSIQKEGGGNLADVLESIGKAIADKSEAKGHLDAITSSARLSAALVSATPPLLLVLLSLGSPAYMADFWESGVWPAVIALAAFLDLAGLACVRRLYRLDLS